MSNAANTAESRHYARLLLMMRRLVKEEFAVTVRLDEEEAPDELLAFASRSRHHLLRQMAKELEEQLGTQMSHGGKDDLPLPQEQVTYYRGAPVVREQKSDIEESPYNNVSKKVYRGRVIG